MLVLGLDFETDSLDTVNGSITEVGAVLWDTLINKPLVIYNKLIRQSKPLTPEIVKLTGLTDDILAKYGEDPYHVLAGLGEVMTKADHVVAHNGTNFDKPFYHNNCARIDLDPLEKHWVDTSVDIPYPDNISTRKLVHLAAEHGFVNPFAHRAVFDVLTMLAVCAKYDWPQVIALSKEENVRLIANVSYADNNKAKERGYRWDATRKQWYKTIKRSFVEREINEANFKIFQEPTRVENGSSGA